MVPTPSRRHFLTTAASLAGSLVAGCSGVSTGSSGGERTNVSTPSPARTPTPSRTPRSTNSPPPTSSATPSPELEESFDTIVDMVEDAGCDPTGSEPCDQLLEQTAADDLLLKFPPGKYRIEEEHRFFELENFGLVGTGEDRRAVQFVFPSGYSGIFLGLWNGRDWLLENFTIQQSMDRRTGVGLVLVTEGGLVMRDVEIAGFSPYNVNGGQRGLYCDVITRDGVADIQRYVHRGPSQVGNYPQGIQAFLADEYHRGTIYCRDWRIENAGENGIYASRTPGDVRVEGGVFRNNDVASIRVCGQGSYVRGATVIVDTDEAHPANLGDYDNTRGIWWESGELAKEGGAIENCDFIMRSTPESQGLLRIERTAGEVTIRNCRFLNQTSWRTVTAMEPTLELRHGMTAVRAENLDIQTRGGAVPAFQIAGRPRSSLKEVRIKHPGQDADALRLDSAPRNVVDGGRYWAGRFPIHLVQGRATRPCSFRLNDQVVLRSDRHPGQRLVPAKDRRQTGDATREYCVPGDVDATFGTFALTGLDEDGLHGHVLDRRGQIVILKPGSGATPE